MFDLTLTRYLNMPLIYHYRTPHHKRNMSVAGVFSGEKKAAGTEHVLFFEN